MTKQPEVGVLVRRAFTPEIRAIDEAKRRITFTASDESVDRYGDVIRAKGWKLDNYKKNPVVLWAHKSNELPVGKCVDVKVEDAPPALVQTVEFADHAFAKTVFDLYKGKFLNAVSVGFMPLEMPKHITDDAGNQTGGYEFTSQELLELSCVPVPANPQALARCVEKGFAVEDLARVFESEMTEVEILRELISIHEEISATAVALAAGVVKQVTAFVKAARPELSAEMSLADLLAALKAGPALAEAEHPDSITSIEQLAAAVASDGLAEFGAAVGAEASGEIQTYSDSRKWRTGKFSLTRELR